MALVKKVAKALKKARGGGGRGRGGMIGKLASAARKRAKGKGVGAASGIGGAMRKAAKAGAQKGRAGMMGGLAQAAGDKKTRKPPRTGGIKPGKPRGPGRQPPVRRPRDEGGRRRRRATPAPMPEFGGMYRGPKPVRSREDAYRTTKSRFMGRDGGSDR